MDEELKLMIAGKKFVGEGARRRVYDLGNGNVLKIAKSKYGIRSNKREVRTYRKAPDRVKKYIAKVRAYDHDYNWLIMKKYNEHFPKSKKYDKKLKKVRRRFKRYGFKPYEVVRSRDGAPNLQNLRIKRNGRTLKFTIKLRELVQLFF
jgi:hypothetical protein